MAEGRNGRKSAWQAASAKAKQIGLQIVSQDGMMIPRPRVVKSRIAVTVVPSRSALSRYPSSAALRPRTLCRRATNPTFACVLKKMSFSLREYTVIGIRPGAQPQRRPGSPSRKITSAPRGTARRRETARYTLQPTPHSSRAALGSGDVGSQRRNSTVNTTRHAHSCITVQYSGVRTRLLGRNQTATAAAVWLRCQRANRM